MILIAVILLFAAAPLAIAAPARPRVTQSLSGQWEFLPTHDDEQIQTGDSYTWGTIPVPALWANAKNIGKEWIKDPARPDANRKLHEQKYCWYRKRFKVDENLKGLNCLLRMVDVRWSAEVWLNGVRLGDHVGAYRPVEFDATSAIKPGEDNVLIIKNGGGHTIPKHEDGVPKIPFGHKGWAQGASGILGDVEMKFFREVTVSRAKIDPNIHDGTAQVAVSLTNYSNSPRRVTVELTAKEKKSKDTASEVYTVPVDIAPGETGKINQIIQIKKPRLWSADNPFLYSLEITVKSDAGACEKIAETFGMREFIVKNGDFYLNGKRIMLRGATDLAITGFPSWGVPAEKLTDRKWIKKYLVDSFRAMNGNVLRTHMGPWYKAYYDIADEYGILLISEFPNWPPEGGKEYYDRPGWTDVLYPELELMAANLWNHPSIIIWAACNEPYIWDYNDHENKVLVPFFKKLDPTRPVMRAGAVSEDIADCHNYEGFWTGTIGDHVRIANHVKDHNPDKPWSDTEYLETHVRGFSRPDNPRAQKWMGYNVTLERAEFTHALFAMEETEVKRRLQYDALLPFWYGMFMSKGKIMGEEPWSTYYALKNGFAPVAVSVDLQDRHFAAGEYKDVPIWAINDTDKSVKGKIMVYVVKDDPPYIYAGQPTDPLFEKTLDLDIPPWSSTPHNVRVPMTKGSYWIYATLSVKGRETVISKRPIHVLEREVSIAPARGAKIAVIEQASVVQDWAKSAGVDIRPVDDILDGLGVPSSLDGPGAPSPVDGSNLDGPGAPSPIDGSNLDGPGAPSPIDGPNLDGPGAPSPIDGPGHPCPGPLVIGKDALSSEAVSSRIDKIREWVNSGGKLVILDQTEWPKDLFGLELVKKRDVSYLFKEKGRENDPIWREIADAYMENWNGSGAEGLTHFFNKPTDWQTLCIGSSDQAGLNARALLRQKMGNGEILACQITIAERLTVGTPMFDTVAERLMVNLITAPASPQN